MKSKMTFGLAAALLLSMIAVGGLFAQVDLPGTVFNSPQSTATLGRIRSDADNVMRADAYSKPTKWYGYVSYATLNKAALGFATGIDDAFLGVHYYGNFWSGLAQNNYTEENVDYFGSKKAYPVYGSTPSVPSPQNLTTENTVAVLIGVAKMGFRLGFNSTHQFFNKNDIAVDNPAHNSADPTTGPENYFYKNYKTETGWIRPQILWSMRDDLIKDIGFKPYAGFNLDFYRDNLEYEMYNAAKTTDRRYVSKSQNFFSPLITLGTGGITLFKQNGFSLSTDLEYQIRLRIYDNEYNYTDGSGKIQQKSFSGNYTGSAWTEESYLYNTITPTLSGSWTKDNLALRFRFQPRLFINSEGTTPMAIKRDADNVLVKDGSLVKNGNEKDTFTFQFNPRLQLAAQWKIIPKLALNAGGEVSTNALSLETVDSRTYSNGTAASGSDKTAKNTGFGTTYSRLFLGFTLNATDNLSFETTVGGDFPKGSTNYINSDNRVKVFSTGDDGLLNFGNIMVSLKF